MARCNRLLVALFAGDVLGKLQVGRPRSFLFGLAHGFAHAGGDGGAAGNLARVLRQRAHHVDDVDYLKLPLFASLDRLLSGEHQHGHGAELGVGRRRHQIRGARPQRREANARLAGQAPVGGRHEPGCLLVAGQNQAYARTRKGVEEIEIFLAGNAENVLDAFIFQTSHQQVGCLHHMKRRQAVCLDRERCQINCWSPPSPSSPTGVWRDRRS